MKSALKRVPDYYGKVKKVVSKGRLSDGTKTQEAIIELSPGVTVTKHLRQLDGRWWCKIAEIHDESIIQEVRVD